MIPAGGRGLRVRAGQPKQYLKLLGRALIEHALQPFLEARWVEGIVVALPPNDRVFASLPCAGDARISTVTGGVHRAESVMAGLRKVQQLCGAARDPWVLVHDAARPCLREEELLRLRDAASSDDGALLALPLSDTIKRAEADRAAATVDRRELWRAQTPQLFRLPVLKRALEQTLEQGLEITDESRAMEAAGFHPKLVPGYEGNLKVTTAEDLPLAEFWLRQVRGGA